jgi:hypothetical protein
MCVGCSSRFCFQPIDKAFPFGSGKKTGMNPMAPAIIQVNSTDPNNVIKTMFWPIQYVTPNSSQPPPEIPKLPDDVPSDIVTIVTVPESVVAIRTFSDMIVEPLVRIVDQTLRQYLQRDGLGGEQVGFSTTTTSTSTTTTITITTNKLLTFAQYDAIYSMGERRCEVHVTLPPGTHPW